MNQAQTNTSVEDLFGLSYEDAQQLASDLAQRPDEESQEMARLIGELEPSFFDLTKGQERLKNLIEFLQHQGLNDAQVMQVISVVVQTASDRTQQWVVDLMPEDLKRKWDDIIKHRPNVYQQMVLVNHVSEKIGRREYDDVYDEMLEQTTADLTSAIENEMELDANVSNLSEEEVDFINSEFEKGNYEQAIALIYKNKQV
jgi:hypothetical protein